MSNPREIKRKKIIDAATELFGLYGYGASMDSIAKLADVSKQTLYAHFKKKDALFLQCMKEKVLSYQINKLVFDRDLPIEKVLLGFAREFHSTLLKPGALQTYRNAVSQIENHPEFASTYLEHGPEKTLLVMAEYLSDKEKDGTISLGIPCEDAAIQLLLMFHGKTVYWQYLGAENRQTEEQRDNYLKSCVDMFLNQVRVNN
ncbi:TetR/AcrR family transcriptional regulator [Vibrio sp. HN007]|uniref:TetR/AcrR family transcriptional regulator n=1 Tax=Vibrio iocasae TaxID=3098914 RepID=UPI0035D497B4